jgi:hypothetical protein
MVSHKFVSELLQLIPQIFPSHKYYMNVVLFIGAKKLLWFLSCQYLRLYIYIVTEVWVFEVEE